jgi:hypothetical protein
MDVGFDDAWGKQEVRRDGLYPRLEVCELGLVGGNLGLSLFQP